MAPSPSQGGPLYGRQLRARDESAPAKSNLIGAGNHVAIDPGCITHEELAEWLKLVDKDVRKGKFSKVTELGEPSALSSSHRVWVVHFFAAVAGSVTLAWFAFLVWLGLKALGLL